jgi:hypothetical protein
MSKVKVQGNPSGTGTLTIAAPDTNTDRTLTLPDASGTLALTSDIPAAPTIASTAEAEAGTNNTNLITPLRMREGFNASGSAPVYACRAWVNFNGTGTVAIRESGNVSSITDNGTGLYTVNFTTEMPDADFAASVVVKRDGTETVNSWPTIQSTAAASVQVASAITTSSRADASIVCVAVFR